MGPCGHRRRSPVRREFHFYGISTRGSSILDVFPEWSELLDLNADIVGKDIPEGAPAEVYHRAIAHIREADVVCGALITSHKVAFHRHSADLFDELDPRAITCQEISCISKRGRRLIGFAKDPVVAGLVLAGFIPSGYWAESGGQAVCLGAGGAGTAISVALLEAVDSPGQVIVTDIDRGHLQRLAEIHRRMGVGDRVTYRAVQSVEDTDEVLNDLTPGSLVVNATGLGKDLPGSPASDRAVFPHRGIVWELNYRGSLEFLRQAIQQADAKSLRIHDGWQYFVHAWTAHIEEVFDISITEPLVSELSQIAAANRPSVGTRAVEAAQSP